MTLSLFTPSRCVLLIGDESLSIYNVTPKLSRLVDSVPWQENDFETVVATLIRKDCKNKPVLVLNDMTDQHFKGGQRLPKVGLLDKTAVLQRRLHVAFPNYPIRGAIAVKSPKSGDEQKHMGNELYLFSAVPMSEPIMLTIDAVKKSMAPVVGFYLLPIESADMVKKLAQGVTKTKKGQSQWAVFIGQHQSGALRQIITRHGQLAMTRMTPLSNKAELNPEEWANEVLQEFRATISYLSRFGYSAEDGTDILVIADPEAGDALEKKIDMPCNYTSFTVSEAAHVLGIKIGIHEARYADLLHVVWVGKKQRFILPMDAPDLIKIHKPRQVATGAILLLLAGFGYTSWQLMDEAQLYYSLKDDLAAQKKLKSEVLVERQQEEERLAAIGFDVNLISGSMEAYHGFEAGEMRPLSFIEKVGKALGPQLRLDQFTMDYIPYEPAKEGYYQPQQDKKQKGPELSAFLQLSFPPSIDPEEGNREIRDLQLRLVELFPGYSVVIDKQVDDRSYVVKTSGELGDKEEVRDEDYVAVITIRGAAQ